MRSRHLPSTPTEVRQAKIAIVLLCLVGLLYAMTLHNSHAQEERLRAAGISIEELLK